MLRKLMCLFKRPKKEPNFCIECKHFAPDESFKDAFKKCDYGRCLAELAEPKNDYVRALVYVCPEIVAAAKIPEEDLSYYFYATTIRTRVGAHCPLFAVW